MNCPTCHTELPDSAKFCGSCGMSLASSAAGAQRAPATPAAQPLPAVASMAPSAVQLSRGFGSTRSYDAIAAEGYDLPVGEILGEAWEKLKPHMGLMIGGTLVVGLLGLVVANVPVVGGFAMTAIFAGLSIAALRIVMGRPLEFSNFFDSFKMFMPLFLLGIVQGLLVTLGILFLILPGMYLSIAFMWATLLVIDRGEEFWPAMMGSMKVVNARFGATFVYALVLGLINIAAAIPTCGLGLLITGPLSIVAGAVAYERIFGIACGVDRIGR